MADIPLTNPRWSLDTQRGILTATFTPIASEDDDDPISFIPQFEYVCEIKLDKSNQKYIGPILPSNAGVTP